jgi:uroporphyrinogen decarboxylase
MTLQNDLIIRAAKKQPVKRTPVWFMRQAGRYLPEYREVRKKVDFLTLCKTPELAAEVTIQPVDIIGVDAAIIFSDILVIPEAMGMHLIVEENKGGPRFTNPIRSRHEIDLLKRIDPESDLGYVMDAIRLTVQELNGRVPLIGFSGSPWTLLTYMVEGSGSKNFRYAKELIYNNPQDAHTLLEKLSLVIADYLSVQIDAGARIVQLFDTWGGILSPDAFKEFSLQYLEQIVASIKRNDEPIIVFCKGCAHSLGDIAGIGADVVGIDWTYDIGEARERIGGTVALQGNMDPTILYASPQRVREEVLSILEKYGPHPGHIFNLGHGVLPDVPLESVKAFVDTVRNESAAYHKNIHV